MLPPLPKSFSPVRPRGVSCLPFLITAVVSAVIVTVGVKIHQAYQIKEFDKYKLPEASFFSHATKVQALYYENPATEEGRKQVETGTVMDRNFAMDLGHLVLDNSVGAVQPTYQTPLYDYRVFEGDRFIDVYLCLKNEQYWIANNSANAPLITIEPGIDAHCVATGHLKNDVFQISALANRPFPDDSNDNSSDDEPPD